MGWRHRGRLRPQSRVRIQVESGRRFQGEGPTCESNFWQAASSKRFPNGNVKRTNTLGGSGSGSLSTQKTNPEAGRVRRGQIHRNRLVDDGQRRTDREAAGDVKADWPDDRPISQT